MRLLVLIAILLSGCAQTRDQLKPNPSPTHSLPQQNLDECLIMDMQGKAIGGRQGGVCLFFDDGSMVRGTAEGLIFYNPDLTMKWTRHLEVHHLMSFDLKRKHLLVISSVDHTFQKEQIRFDRLVVFDLNGNEVHSFDFYRFKDQLLKLSGAPARAYNNEPGDREFSHANTFYEIPENQTAKTIPAFSQGNYIVYTRRQGLCFILNHTLEKILWSAILDPKKLDRNDENIHDVQVLPNGKLLFFNNSANPRRPSEPGFVPYSDIEEYDPRTETIRVVFQATPPESFYEPYRGGIQVLANGNLLTAESHDGGRAYEVDQNGKIVWSITNPVMDPSTGKPAKFSTVRRVDLTDFLRASQ